MHNNGIEDNILWKILDLAKDIIKCNVLWFLFLLPVFTAGASCVALSACMQRLLDGKGVKARDFFSALRADFKYATIGYLCIAAFLFVLGFNIYLLPALENPVRSIYAAVCLVMLLLVIFWAEQALPLLAAPAGKIPPKDIPVTAFVLAIRCAALTASMAVVSLVPVFIMLVMPGRFLWLFPVYMTAGGALTALFHAFIAGRCWRKLW